MDATLLICTLSLDSLPEDTVAVRCIVYSNIETMIEYYKTIVGVKDITIESLSVPSSFDIKYIGPMGDPELTYPAYDIAVLKKDLESYKTVITHAIMGEKERVRLIGSMVSPTLSIELSDGKKELFNSLNQIASVIESYTMDGKAPDIVGWMLSPKHMETREAYGIKFITDVITGTKWDSLLGTPLFPDFIISRRISSAAWTFQHPTTTTMLASIVEWWVTAHMRTEDDWIHSSEIEFDALLEVFRTKGIPTEYHSEQMDALKLALLDIEETVLGNPELYSSTDLIQFKTADNWRFWIDRMLRFKGVMLESNVDFINAMIHRWMRDGWGLRKKCLPAPVANAHFREAWTALTTVYPVNEETILKWIRLLNINDPVYTIHVRHEPKQQILDDWIPVAILFIKASHPLLRAKSLRTYDWLRNWILKYVPSGLFTPFMIPKRFYPSIISAGYPRIHSTTGYFFVGLELPDSETDLAPYGDQEEVD